MQVAAFFVISVIALLLLLWRFQERILFQPPVNTDLEYKAANQINFKAADGQDLCGYLVGDRSAETVVLAFHGNADLSVWQLDWAAAIAQRFNAAVFLAEYRGYGGLPGLSSYESSKLDSEAAYLTVTSSLNVSPDRIVAFGHSLGSAIAAELALRHPVRALILQSPFTSARQMSRLTFARLLTPFWDLVSRIHFDTVSTLKSVASPVFVIHGTRDLVVPVRMGKAVFAAARNRGKLQLVEKAGHNNIVEVAGEDYWRWFGSALGPSSAI